MCLASVVGIYQGTRRDYDKATLLLLVVEFLLVTTAGWYHLNIQTEALGLQLVSPKKSMVIFILPQLANPR
jgi:hypothetical protein